MLAGRKLIFAIAYAAGGNGEAAAIEAGYSPRSAKFQASRMIREPAVAEEVERRRKILVRQAEASAARTLADVVQELERVGFANFDDVLEVGESGAVRLNPYKLNRDFLAAVSSVKIDPDGSVELKLWNKPKALVDLGRHLGGFTGELEAPIAGEPRFTPERLLEGRGLELARRIALILLMANKRAA